MKQITFGKMLKNVNDYSGCLRYENGELVDPVAYRRYLAERINSK